MDEFQFIKSLDALLANDIVDETETARTEDILNNSTLVRGQGILSGPVAVETEWLPRTNISNTTVGPFSTFHPTTLMASINSTAQEPSLSAASYPQQYTSLINNSTYTNMHVEQPAGMLGTNTSTTVTLPAAAPSVQVLAVQKPTSSAVAMKEAVGKYLDPSMTAAPSGTTSVCSANSRCSSYGSSNKQKSISARSVGSTISTGTGIVSSRKRSRRKSSMAVSDSEDESSRRRSDRNLREQRRSQRVTEKIDELREVLAAASIRFKPDKFSTLVSVVEYVKQLQTRSTLLDSEHKKLLDTISRTNEMVNESYLPASMTGNGVSSSHSNDTVGCDTSLNAQPDSTVSNSSDIYNDDELVFVRNVDYRCIFDSCGMPLAVASIDGRLLDCNEEFVKLTGYRRNELLPTEYQQQAPAVIADEVLSSSGPSALPDVPISGGNDDLSNNLRTDVSNPTDITSSTNTGIYRKQEYGLQQDSDVKGSRKDCQTPTRNFSLFDLLSRKHMEEVFVSLSEMLKRPPRDKVGIGSVTIDDHWWGNVHLNRNTRLEIQMNISLVRSPQGRAKFFDCSLTPLAV